MIHSLQKGGNLSLTKTAPDCNEIIVAIKWLKKTHDETEFDIDASAFMLAENGKIRNDEDFIFYNQPKSIDNAIELINSQEPNVQFFKINLSRIALEIAKISLVLTLHEAKKRQQNFGMLDSIVVKILNATNKEELSNYVLTDIEIETALILAELYRYKSEWKLKAIGQGYIDGLDVLAKNYGVNIDSPHQETKPAPPKKPTVVKYTEIIAPTIEKFKTKAKRAKHENLNESGTRILIDYVIQGILGYKIEHIKTEQRLPKRQLRVDYLLSLNEKNVMVVEAKQIGATLNEKHISQATSYAYFFAVDFALLTNGVEWKLYYVIPKKFKKYEYHLVFSINLLEFNDKIAEKLFSISRFGIAENSLAIIKAKMTSLNTIDEIILSDEVIEKISSLMNNKNEKCQITSDEIRDAIVMNILK